MVTLSVYNGDFKYTNPIYKNIVVDKKYLWHS